MRTESNYAIPTWLVFPLLIALVFLLNPEQGNAGSATWKLSPANGNWNTAANWTPETVPNDASDVATLSLSNSTSISIFSTVTVAGIVFSPGASQFTITASFPSILLFAGFGIENNSGVEQNFRAPQLSGIEFSEEATAGNLAAFTNLGDSEGGFFGGSTTFLDKSSADQACFINEGGAVKNGFGGATTFDGKSTAAAGVVLNLGANIGDAGSGGVTNFFDSTSAGQALITSEPGLVNGAPGGETRFFASAHGGEATIIAHGGTAPGVGAGQTSFLDSSTAERAALVADGGGSDVAGGLISFFDNSSGGRATVQLLDRGQLDISLHAAGSVSIGSLEGNGSVHLGGVNLAVGGNDRTTIFSGRIADGGAGGGTGGSLTKDGKGRLTISGSNTYSGGTIINRGTLVVSSGNATGSGKVEINGGTLAGHGTISGAVIVGTGTGSGARISPGGKGVGPAVLTIAGAIAFHSDGAYAFGLDSQNGVADSILAAGVTIDAGADFEIRESGGAPLPPGTMFIAIDNTAVSPINGRFENLPDDTVITIGSNNFAVSYEGGDGNDLTLTVVP